MAATPGDDVIKQSVSSHSSLGSNKEFYLLLHGRYISPRFAIRSLFTVVTHPGAAQMFACVRFCSYAFMFALIFSRVSLQHINSTPLTSFEVLITSNTR